MTTTDTGRSRPTASDGGLAPARTESTATLLDTLARLMRTARFAGQRHSDEFGLSDTPLGILKALAEGDTRSGDLAARLQIAPSVISRALVPLEQAGLVERRPDPDDARASRVGLTGQGRSRLAASRQGFVDRFSPVLDEWSSDDLTLLNVLMGRLESALCHPLDSPHHRPTNEGTE